MQSMSVRPEQVTALAAQIRTGSNAIRGELDQLEQKIAKLRASWSGESQASYDEAQRRWNQSLSEMQQLLTQIANKTDEISQGYVNTDAQSAKRFSI